MINIFRHSEAAILDLFTAIGNTDRATEADAGPGPTVAGADSPTRLRACHASGGTVIATCTSDFLTAVTAVRRPIGLYIYIYIYAE
jgi:hypothetical protein